MLVIAPEVFEIRAPRNLLPFVLAEPSKSLHSSIQSPLESPDCGVIPRDPIICTSSFESVEQFAAPECTPAELLLPRKFDAAEALLSAASVVSSASKSASEQGQKLTVFPWGGPTSTGISLTNTCPLDNWLMIFQALTKSHKAELSDLPESAHIIGTSLKLIDVIEYFYNRANYFQ